MLFEYDPIKSSENKRKHGIDFEDAQTLWSDPALLVIDVVTEDEPRQLVIGENDGRMWTAIITHRANNIRLISVRRSRKSEVKLYEQQETESKGL
ncbi:BrnT family toxin [Candidatus Acetothermia bacterium]|nr:BrnT family toxin [Candidatus Acetothermia bacterium]MBI3642617.1 BrnT family toxin [Candidatus Acetothermia bacterium]